MFETDQNGLDVCRMISLQWKPRDNASQFKSIARRLHRYVVTYDGEAGCEIHEIEKRVIQNVPQRVRSSHCAIVTAFTTMQRWRSALQRLLGGIVHLGTVHTP